MPIELGRVVRLQVQTQSLKRGERPRRVYDPGPLLEVARMRLTPRGAAGLTATGETVLDVHHADHPASQHAPGREVSFGFTSHYRQMRDRYGPHVATGCAGVVWAALDAPTGAESCSRRWATRMPVGAGCSDTRPLFASRPQWQTTGSRQRWPKASVYRTPAAESPSHDTRIHFSAAC